MITYGLTMQGKKQEVPAELAAWLLERESQYHTTIEFEVGFQKVRPEHAAKYEPIAEKYFQLFGVRHPMAGILTVSFLYRTEIWFAKIIGGLDEGNNLVDRRFGGTVKPLGMLKREEISGWTPTAEFIEPQGSGLRRKTDNPLLDQPRILVSLPGNSHWTSQFSMTGQELDRLLQNPETRTQAGQAIWQKDWETLRRLKKEQSV